MTRIALFGDAQLGARQYAKLKRESDYASAMSYIFNHARASGCCAMIMAGDQMEESSGIGWAVRLLQREVAGFGNPVFAIAGNHDLDPTWIDVYGATRLDSGNTADPAIHTIGEGDDAITVTGMDNCHTPEMRVRLVNLASTLQQAGKTVDVVVLHTSLKEMIGWSGGQHLSAHELATILAPAGVKVVALGDIHDFKYMEVMGVQFIEPGSPELTAKNENPSKCYVQLIKENGKFRSEMHPIPTRPVLFGRVENQEQLRDLIRRVAKTQGDRGPLVFVEYPRTLPVELRDAMRKGMEDHGALIVPFEEKIEADASLSPEALLAKFGQDAVHRQSAMELIASVIPKTVEVPHVAALVQALVDMAITPGWKTSTPQVIAEFAERHYQLKPLVIKVMDNPANRKVTA